jgi:hypothetical protein
MKKRVHASRPWTRSRVISVGAPILSSLVDEDEVLTVTMMSDGRPSLD